MDLFNSIPTVSRSLSPPRAEVRMNSNQLNPLQSLMKAAKRHYLEAWRLLKKPSFEKEASLAALSPVSPLDNLLLSQRETFNLRRIESLLFEVLKASSGFATEVKRSNPMDQISISVFEAKMGLGNQKIKEALRFVKALREQRGKDEQQNSSRAEVRSEEKTFSLDEAYRTVLSIRREYYKKTRQDPKSVEFWTQSDDLDNSYHMAKEILKHPIQKIAIIGRGLEYLATLLAAVGKDVTFISEDSAFLRGIREWNSSQEVKLKIKAVKGIFGSFDLSQAEIQAGTFDLVTLIDLIGPDPKGTEGWSYQIKELLKPEGGFVVMDTQTWHYPYDGKGVVNHEQVFKDFAQAFPDRMYVAGDLRGSYNHDRSRNILYQVKIKTPRAEVPSARSELRTPRFLERLAPRAEVRNTDEKELPPAESVVLEWLSFQAPSEREKYLALWNSLKIPAPMAEALRKNDWKSLIQLLEDQLKKRKEEDHDWLLLPPLLSTLSTLAFFRLLPVMNGIGKAFPLILAAIAVVSWFAVWLEYFSARHQTQRIDNLRQLFEDNLRMFQEEGKQATTQKISRSEARTEVRGRIEGKSNRYVYALNNRLNREFQAPHQSPRQQLSSFQSYRHDPFIGGSEGQMREATTNISIRTTPRTNFASSGKEIAQGIVRVWQNQEKTTPRLLRKLLGVVRMGYDSIDLLENELERIVDEQIIPREIWKRLGFEVENWYAAETAQVPASFRYSWMKTRIPVIDSTKDQNFVINTGSVLPEVVIHFVNDVFPKIGKGSKLTVVYDKEEDAIKIRSKLRQTDFWPQIQYQRVLQSLPETLSEAYQKFGEEGAVVIAPSINSFLPSIASHKRLVINGLTERGMPDLAEDVLVQIGLPLADLPPNLPAGEVEQALRPLMAQWLQKGFAGIRFENGIIPDIVRYLQSLADEFKQTEKITTYA